MAAPEKLLVSWIFVAFLICGPCCGWTEQYTAVHSRTEQCRKREAGDDRIAVEVQYSGVEVDSPACTIELIDYAGCGRHLGKRDLSHKEFEGWVDCTIASNR